MKNRQKVHIQLHSEIVLLSDGAFPPGSEMEQLFDEYYGDAPDDGGADAPPPGYVQENGESESIRLDTYGMLTDDGKTVKLSYSEESLEGLEGCIASVIFEHDSPWLISMLRSGKVSTAMVFNGRDKRQICSYDTGDTPPFEITVCTRRIVNELKLGGGRLELEYWVELRGVRVELNRITLDVTPAVPSPLERHLDDAQSLPS